MSMRLTEIRMCLWRLNQWKIQPKGKQASMRLNQRARELLGCIWFIFYWFTAIKAWLWRNFYGYNSKFKSIKNDKNFAAVKTFKQSTDNVLQCFEWFRLGVCNIVWPVWPAWSRCSACTTKAFRHFNSSHGVGNNTGMEAWTIPTKRFSRYATFKCIAWPFCVKAIWFGGIERKVGK